jgi:hypothetical protein
MKTFALILGTVGYAMAGVGDLAPYHLGKTWHYSYGMSSSDYLFSDKLNVYMKVKSLDSAAGKTKIILSVSAVGTRISGQGSSPIDTTFAQTLTDSNGYVFPQSPSFLDFTPFNTTHSASGPSFGNERDTVIAGMAAKAIDQKTSLYDKVWATGIGLIHSWQRDANMIPFATRDIEFLGFEEKPVALLGDLAPFQTGRTWHYHYDSEGYGSADSLECYIKVQAIDSAPGKITVTLRVTYQGTRKQGATITKLDTTYAETLHEINGIITQAPGSSGLNPFYRKHFFDADPKTLPYGMRVVDLTIGGKQVRALDSTTEDGLSEITWAPGIGLYKETSHSYHFSPGYSSGLFFVGFEELPAATRTRLSAGPRASRVKVLGIGAGNPGISFEGVLANGRYSPVKRP